MEKPILVRTFQLTDLEDNHNKFWTIKWDGTYAITEWGRVGVTSQTSKTPKLMSQREVDAKIRSQEREGYKEVFAHKSVAVATPTTNPHIVRWLTLIAEAAQTSISDYLATTTDSMSLEQIAAGRALLKDYTVAHGFDKARPIVERYYNTIPTKLPRKIDVHEVVHEFDPSEQENRLNQLEAAISSNVQVDTSAPFALSEVDDEEKSRIVKLVVGTARHRDIDASEIKDVLAVKIHAERAAYEACEVKNPTLLFHGTAAGNIAHILRSGLIVPRYHANGRAFGDGIYFANVSTKSIQYCYEHKSTRFLLVAEAKLGKTYVPRSSQDVSRNKMAPDGYDSVHAKSSITSYLSYDEVVVYNRAQQTIKYLVVMK